MHHFTFLLQCMKVPIALHILANTSYYLFYCNHSSWCEVVLHCSFGLHSLMAKWISVHVFVSHSCIFFGEILIQILSPFLNWVMSFYYRGQIPWMEEPGRLQSMGLLGVGHDWATSLSLFTFMHWGRKWQPTPVLLPGVSQGRGSLVGCCLWGRTESDTTEATYQQQQYHLYGFKD